jgi:hypothetical protein
MLQKREMQMEIQRLNERENKRRKLTAASSVNPAAVNNVNNNTIALMSNIKSMATKCLIF